MARHSISFLGLNGEIWHQSLILQVLYFLIQVSSLYESGFHVRNIEMTVLRRGSPAWTREYISPNFSSHLLVLRVLLAMTWVLKVGGMAILHTQVRKSDVAFASNYMGIKYDM